MFCILYTFVIVHKLILKNQNKDLLSSFVRIKLKEINAIVI